MSKRLQKKVFDWSAEFSFSAILFGLVVLVLALDYLFWNAGYTTGLMVNFADTAIIGALCVALLYFAIAHVDLKGKLRALGKSYNNLLAQSERDVLTGVLNRETFVSKAKQALEALAKNRFFALFLIDVDHFKQVNDTHGHPAGDRVLVFVAEKLQAHFPDARVGRLGGDEFAVLIEHSDPMTGKWANELCAEFAAGLAGKVNIGAQRLAVSASVGIALAPDHGKTWSSLVINADMALYASKKNGRACSTLFQEDMLTDIRNEKALVRELRAAMLLRHLRVAYQPIVDADGQLIAFEALLRWRHPLRGVIPPDVFIPVAERALMIGEIGYYVLRQVGEDIADLPEVSVNVNLSATQIAMPDLKENMLDILAETATDPRRIVLEITESASLAVNECIAGQISALQDAGFRIALDDFGMGYSEFNQLRALPYDVIKIDKSYICALGSDHVTDVFVSAVVDIARRCGKYVVAEGIETEDDLLRARAAGCDRFQGYYFGKPVFLEEIAGDRLDYSCEPVEEAAIHGVG
ncbi:putative bifunctional diguanylate cyclase/phosphodiesterase [Hoeflea sp.]|uniref:putative bifunctional diguanylate cyclase/phosphodiesterase n=1 Tax=Hoeflea sp. TaxID=1940281 RepID=UPI003A910AAD